MDSKYKTEQILKLLKRRTTLPPREHPFDSRLVHLNCLPWETVFSTFNKKHLEEAGKVIRILQNGVDFNDFIYLAEEIRGIENDDLFLYALYTAVLYREDCKGVIMPRLEECVPHWFFSAETIHEVIQLSIHRPNEDHVVTNQKTAESSEPESRLAYFREDIGLNTHHWAWHVVFPVDWNENETGIIKDRKGELFFYMHQQMIARYNCERLSNGLNRVAPLQDFRQTLVGYAPHLTSQITGVHFGSRPEGLKMSDIPNFSVQELELWRTRIYDAIDNKFVRDINGRDIPLDELNGIDILGALVEASLSSVNLDFYGNLHNIGHNVISAVHDPDGRFRKYLGVMAFIEAASRDPIFYRWHKFIDDIFQRHKATLTPYTKQELTFESIKVASAEIRAKQRNVIETFMTTDEADLSHAPFLRTQRKISVRYDRLDHMPFSYILSIENYAGVAKDTTIRIFMAPKRDETGNPFELNEQRKLMIELDKFHRQLAPGANIITRLDKESSVTLSSRGYTFTQLMSGAYEPTVDYCSCGWPDYMLVPKGTGEGLDCVLFVMCTDYRDDVPGPDPRISVCSDAISYCGAKDQKYPDAKPMGFPFDRNSTSPSIEEWLTPNMFLTDVSVRFLGSSTTKEWTISVSL